MKKLFSLFTIVLFLSLSVNSFAQVNGYTFAQTSGIYQGVSGAGNGDTVSFSTRQTDLDDTVYTRSLPFPFTFNGIVYTSVKICTNGYITFGTTSPNQIDDYPISTSTAYAGAISPMGADLIGNRGFTANRTNGFPNLTGVISSQFVGLEVGRNIFGNGIPVNTKITALDQANGIVTMSANATSTGSTACIVASGSIMRRNSGSSPSRIHTIQFKNFRNFNSVSADGNVLNFQIKLYEGSNKIEIVYGTCTATNTISELNQVGLRGATNADFINRTTTTDWSATNAGGSNTATCTILSTVTPASGLTFTWSPPPPVITTNLKMFIEGFYNSSTDLQVSDTVKIYLRNSGSPYALKDSAKAVLSDSGKASMTFSKASTGTYYIVLTHRNSIETWSASAVAMTQGNTVNYDFTNAASQAFGNNMKQVDSSPARFAIYSGDVNQDGTADASDLSEVENDAAVSLSGYVNTDVNGDNFVDAEDLSIIENNVLAAVTIVTP